MKRIVLLFSLISTLFTIAQHAPGHEGCGRVKKLNQFDRSNALSIADIQKTEQYDVHYYFLDLSMSNLNTDVSGNVEIHSTALQDMTEFVFELHDNFTITNLEIDGQTETFTRNNTGVYVSKSITTGSSFVCSITYNGTAPNQVSNPLGGGGLTNDSSPSWGNQVTWSLSEPFSAFEWFPCKQSLNDKIDSTRAHFTIPDSCKAGSNGLLVNDIDLGNGNRRMEWLSHYPIDYYLISVSIAEYVDYSFNVTPTGASSPILVQNYIYNNPATLPNFQNDIDETGDFLELFSEKFGLYPFHDEKYGHCMAPLGGGMEHQTMTTQGYFTPTLTAHELGHQWFGDYVTAKSWSDLWLNEGFASYSEYIMQENLYPGQEFGSMLNVHNNVMSQLGGSVWIEDSLNSNRLFSGRLTYDKGSAIIHTLRYMLNNDNQFFEIIRSYLADNAFGVVTADDFFDKVEVISGLDLTEYKNQWYYGEGFPTYSGAWNQIGGELYFNLLQTTSTTTTPLFTNDLDLKISRNGIADTIIRIGINDLSTDYVGTINGTVTDVQIDPNNWIINGDNGFNHDPSLTSIEEINSFYIDVFPNPANESITINSLNELTSIEVYSISGKLVLTDYNKNNSFFIDLSDLENGAYNLKMKSKGRVTTKKIMVIH